MSDIPTELVDLHRVSLKDLLSRDDLDGQIEQVLRQVERPRANQGGSGPPGRAD